MTPRRDNPNARCRVPVLDMSRPRIAFIVTFYNYEDYIFETLASISKQTWKNHKDFEVVLIDDGSRRECRERLRALQSEFESEFDRFKILTNEETMGKLHALQKGVREVRFPISIILDADDTIAPSFVEETVRLLLKEHRKDNSVAFVYTHCTLINEFGTIVGEGRSMPFDAELLKHASYIPETAPTLTTVLQDIAEHFDLSVKRRTKHHKWNLIVNPASGRGWKGVYLPEPLLNYRMHETNLSGIGNRFRENPFAALSDYWKPDPQ